MKPSIKFSGSAVSLYAAARVYTLEALLHITVSRDQILRHARGQGNNHFPCSADHEQDWQPYPVDPYSAICDDHTYIHTYNRKQKSVCVLTKQEQ